MRTEFERESLERIQIYSVDEEWNERTKGWIQDAFKNKYMYNFFWMDRPIIQIPTDMIAMQEIIWTVKPDLIIETGIAHGGSLIMNASILALLDLSYAIEEGRVLDPAQPSRMVFGIDIDIRAHNRSAIEAHPMAHRIEMIEGSSIDPSVVAKVHDMAAGFNRVLVCLDSNHTHAHALAELEAYAPLVSVGSYCVVFDTIIETLPADMFPDRPWGHGDNPWTAAQAYLAEHPQFEIDKQIDHKLLISVAPDGYLKRIA